MDMYLGIDVGGTFTKLCVADSELRILKSWKQPTEKTGDIVDFLEGLIRQSKQEFPDISCVGMGLPGTVDAKSGIVHTAPAIIAGQRNIKQELVSRLQMRVSIENDVACWAIAEGKIGACRGVADYVFITLGTGIGSCIVIDGKIYKGADLSAGEVGYMVFMEDLDRQAKSFDEFGSFEAKASAASIERDFHTDVGGKETGAEMFARFRDPADASAQAFASRKMDYLAVGIANVITILNPESVVLAGGITAQWDYLYQQIGSRLARLIPNRVDLKKSETGAYGGALGAILHALTEQKS